MNTFGSSLKLINQDTYQAGWDAKMSGAWFGIFGYWTDASWRAGWRDAKKSLKVQADSEVNE